MTVDIYNLNVVFLEILYIVSYSLILWILNNDKSLDENLVFTVYTVFKLLLNPNGNEIVYSSEAIN